MSALDGYRRAERDALDALVDAEVELVLRRRPRPVVEPEVNEALFLEQATAFLLRHADPARLIEELQRRITSASAVDAPPAPQPEPQTEAPTSEAPRPEEDPT